MNNSSKSKIPAPTVGGTSLLVIFAILCLVTFSLLALSTTLANGRLSDAAANSIVDYYAADAEAENILSAIRRGEIPPGVTEAEGVYSYSCKISDKQALFVEVKITGSEYEILKWQAASTVEWEAAEEMPVWDGDFPDMGALPKLP